MSNKNCGTRLYKSETGVSFAGFLTEAPNFLAVAVSAIISGSISMYMDLLNAEFGL